MYVKYLNDLSEAKRLHNKNYVLLIQTYKGRESMLATEYVQKMKRYARLCRKYRDKIQSLNDLKYALHSPLPDLVRFW